MIFTMKKKIYNILKIFAAFAIVTIALKIFLANSDPKELSEILKDTDIKIFIFAMIPALLTLLFRAIRWSIILPAIDGASKNNLADYTIIGFMINNIVPARLGEAVRIFLLWSKNKYPLSVSVGSLILERIIDTVIYFLFFGIPAYAFSTSEQIKKVGLGFIVAALIILLGFIIFCIIFNIKKEIILPQNFPGKNKIEKIISELISTLHWTNSVKKIFLFIFLSILTSFCYVAIFYMFGKNFGLSIGILKGMFFQGCASLGSAIPLAPGYIGTVHAAILQGFDIIGMNIEKGRIIAILYHAANYIPVTIAGFIYMLKTDLKFSGLLKVKEYIDSEKEKEENL